MPAVLILSITEEHTESYNAAVGEVAREGNFLTVLDAFPLESTREYVRDNIANSYPHFVAVSDGQVIGWCDITPKSDRPVHRHCGTLGLGILAPYRRQGIGRQLMDAALAAAKQKGWQRIELTVRETNHAAIALYETMGFVLEGTLRKEWHAGGQYYDTHVMALLLPPLCDSKN